jgi:hypothetical protein
MVGHRGDAPLRKLHNLAQVSLIFHHPMGFMAVNTPGLTSSLQGGMAINAFLNDMNAQVFKVSMGAAYPLKNGESSLVGRDQRYPAVFL